LASLADRQRRIDLALKSAKTTRFVCIDANATAFIPTYFSRIFANRPAIIIADPNTFAAAGQAVIARLERDGIPTIEPCIFDADDFYAEMKYVEQLQSILAGNDAIPIAVGSGTINDITKLAAFRAGRQYMSVATAASMDGYTAFGASIAVHNFKHTFYCPAPVAIIVDLDVIAAAPPLMNAAGYADLIAKIPAGADWMVVDALGIEQIDADAWSLVQTPLREWVAGPEGVRLRDMSALANLMEGLLMSGLAMQKTETSRPASGAEHQFSHLWDMQHLRYDGAIPLHGFKVGIGSLASEALYEMILPMTVTDIEPAIERVQSFWPKWEEIERTIRSEFSDENIRQQVIQQSREKYLKPLDITERLRTLGGAWPELQLRLKEQLMGSRAMRKRLSAAGAPTSPEEIGLSLERLQKSYLLAQLIRNRYTILDLVLELGLWQPCMKALFRPGGFWSDRVQN